MLNVLVVDDSEVMRQMVIRTLRLSGVSLRNVFQAADGASGLEILEREWVDLALVDINMPVLDGQVMIERIRASELLRDLAIIVVSTDGSESRRDALRDYRVSFVEKPFTAERLRTEVLRVTGLEISDEMAGSGAAGGDFDF